MRRCFCLISTAEHFVIPALLHCIQLFATLHESQQACHLLSYFKGICLCDILSLRGLATLRVTLKAYVRLRVSRCALRVNRLQPP